MGMLKKSVTALAAIIVLCSMSYQSVGNQPHWDDGYRIFQDHAPNFIHVEILNVNVTSNKTFWFASHSDRVEVEARVLKVVRTVNDLRPGMIIPILYNRKAAAGGTFAETPGIPEAGAVLPAFIKIKSDHFVPAARHHTFAPLAEQQLKSMDREAVELTETQIAALRLPKEMNTSLKVNTDSELPLMPATAVDSSTTAPLKAEAFEPNSEVEVELATTELPMVEAETPGLITPTIPEPAAEMPIVETGSPSQLDINTASPTLRAEVVTPESAEVVAEPAEQPVIDTGSINMAEKTKRRTVVVVPPTELRSRRQQAMQTALEMQQQRNKVAPTSVPAPKLEPITPVAPVLKAEVIPAPPSVPDTIEMPTPMPTISNPPSDAPTTEPVAVSDTDVAVNSTASPPALRAEPVAVPEPTEPTVPNVEGSDTAANITAPAASAPPREEPVTITDFTPAAAAPTSESAPDMTNLTASDRANMKTYADIYYSLQKASTAAEDKQYDKAKELYQKSLQDLQTLKAAHPEFQPFMVEYRIRDTSRKLEQLVVNTPKP